MADVLGDLRSWSTTAASNRPAGGTTIGTGLDDNLREIQKVVRQDLSHKGADISSASTTDIGAVPGLFHDITGTTTITAFGTVSAGIWKILKYEGALTITHNATTLILLTGANRTTVAGDVQILISEGSGNWREVMYMPVNTQLTNSGVKFAASQAASADVNTLDDYEEGSWTPTLAFGGGTTGITYGTQVGRYIKVGKKVTVSFRIVLTSNGSSTGSATVGTLPFTADTVTGLAWTSGGYAENLSAAGPLICHVSSGSTAITLIYGDATGAANLTDTTITDTADMAGTITYQASA